MIPTTYIIAFILRFIPHIVYPSLTSTLANFIEISTPISSFKSLKESFYYIQNNINLYDGGVVYHPPLLIYTTNLIEKSSLSSVIFGFELVYSLLDIWTAYRLVQINQWYNKNFSGADAIVKKDENSNENEKNLFSDNLILVFYLFNPLLILSNWSKSTVIFTNVTIIESIYQLGLNKNTTRSLFMLSFAGYLSFYPWYLIIPLQGLWIYVFAANMTKADVAKKVIINLAVFASFIATLFALSYYVTQSWKFLSIYHNIIFFNNIVPNIGLWWYFFTEMFEFFTNFFKLIFNLYAVVFVIPFTLKFSHDPLFGIYIAYFFLVFIKTYPSIGDIGFLLSVLPLFKKILDVCDKKLINGLILLHGFILSPIFYYLWIYLGSGNSNFFYAINLTYNLSIILILIDLIWGRLIIDFYHDNKLHISSKVRLTQI